MIRRHNATSVKVHMVIIFVFSSEEGTLKTKWSSD